jgi:hypothetical protein
MQTIEFIPNYSLQEEWTEAWNLVNQRRGSAIMREELDRALKWTLWISHGLLHAPSRASEKGGRQYRDLA